jgi:ATP-dependent protease HslVU (ClpYQ) peptidase subunit
VTCIAGIVDTEGNIIIGGDSAAISEYDLLNLSLPKVFIKDGYIFGFAGHFRFAQIVQHVFQPPKYRGEEVDYFLARNFAEALRQTVKFVGYSKNKDGRDEGGLALIGFQKRLFIMQDEFDVIETRDGIAAIGCGYPYAIGAMKALTVCQPDKIPVGSCNVACGTAKGEDIVRTALQVSEHYSGGVRAPFTILKLEGATNARSRERGRAKHTRRNRA